MRISPSQVEGWHGLPPLVCRLWAGVACGVLSGAAALAWFAMHSLMRREFWWSKFNVAAGWFYGTAVYTAGLSWVSLSGASVIVLFFCLAGACYGWGWGGLVRTRTSLTALLYVAAIYVFAGYFFWPSFGPFARLWFPWTATMPAHVALFAMLTRYPGLYLRLLSEFADPDRLQRKQPVLRRESAEVGSSGGSFEARGDGSAPADRIED